MRKSLMRMTLRQLQIFNEVCDLRSYSRAAEEMSLTQPAVSLQIRQLEELIGQPLFDYVGKKLYMTEAAEALQRASRDIFGRLENLDMQLSDMQGSLQGQLKLAVESSAKYFVPHLFAAFKRQHPEVNLHPDGGQPRPGDPAPVGQPRRPGHHVHGAPGHGPGVPALPQQPDRRRGAADHPLCKLQSLRLQDLEPHTLLVREQGSGTRKACEEYFKDKRVHFTQTLEVASTEAQRECVVAAWVWPC
jgi:DNA-binding transcriptional LysR family regulator